MQKSRPTQNKRMRERARQERQKEKVARRLEANKVRKATILGSPGDEDPDIAGIVPGPQPSPWGDDELDAEVEAETEAETEAGAGAEADAERES